MIVRMSQIHLSLGSNIIKDSLHQLLLLLVEPPILGYPEYTVGFTLHGNASAKGVNAVRLQYQGNELKVIEYESRTFASPKKISQL